MGFVYLEVREKHFTCSCFSICPWAAVPGGREGAWFGFGHRQCPQNIPDMEMGITKSPLQLSAGILLQNLFSAPMQGNSLVYLRQLEGCFTQPCAFSPDHTNTSCTSVYPQVHGHSSRLWAPHGLLQHQLTAPREAEATHGSPPAPVGSPTPRPG